jgi:hypothetical protein
MEWWKVIGERQEISVHRVVITFEEFSSFNSVLTLWGQVRWVQAVISGARESKLAFEICPFLKKFQNNR